ncbi:MAG: hypothetical protein R2734_14210 [Nocardioides sp.]
MTGLSDNNWPVGRSGETMRHMATPDSETLRHIELTESFAAHNYHPPGRAVPR